MESLEKSVQVSGRILEAAFYQFRQYGFRAITMDDIANNIGVSKKTLYAHFADKDELVREAVEKRITEIRIKCESFRESAGDAIEEMFLCMHYLDGLFRNMNPVFLLELHKFHTDAFRIFQHYKDDYLIKMVRTNLETGIVQKIYREEINLDILSVFRLESSMLCFQPGIFSRDRFEMSHVHRELMEHFLYGVATVKGHRLIEKYKQKYLQNH
ncbi:MAG TPA: TetR/AcrR family transcriptional regulator [Chitinophagaceae bacterium]|nr:TetR/AcrR family transcriptional regulator [Chitinophagaceae bacterium]